MSADDLGRKRPALKGRLLALGLAVVAGLGIGGGLYLWRGGGAASPTAGLASTGRPQIGGDFQLVDEQGRAADESLLRGKWSAVFFGYTYCPDFCPATLQTLQAASEQLGPRAQDLQVLFISVDPARDTPEALRSYLAGFDFPGGVHGLTGSPAQLETAAKAWRAYYQKRGDGPDYAMDHVTTVYLMDPQGRFDRPLSHSLDPKQMAGQISAAMGA